MLNVLFIAAYSEENLLLAKALCKSPTSKSLLWRNSLLDKTKENYEYVVGEKAIEDKFLESIYFMMDPPGSKGFFDGVTEFITNEPTLPDAIVLRGETPQAWPVSVYLSIADTTSIGVLILDRFVSPVEEFDEECLGIFDVILGMGPSTKIKGYEDKTVSVFSRFESFYFQDMPEMLGYQSVDTPLVICNQENYEQLSRHPKLENFSFINGDNCDDQELAVYVGLSDTIIDATDDEEFKWILKKINKKGVPIEEFGTEKLDKILVIRDGNRNLEDFANFMEKKITENLKIEAGNIVQGTEII